MPREIGAVWKNEVKVFFFNPASEIAFGDVFPRWLFLLFSLSVLLSFPLLLSLLLSLMWLPSWTSSTTRVGGGIDKKAILELGIGESVEDRLSMNIVREPLPRYNRMIVCLVKFFFKFYVRKMFLP